MPWFKVDDKLHDHRKTRTAGDAAMGLWVLAGSWASDNLSDGFVPAALILRWSTRRQAERLVAAGLWNHAERDGERGYQFHQWSEFQPTSSRVKAEREAARDRMSRARSAKRSGDVRANSDGTDGVTSDEVRVTPTRPDPNPSVGGSRSPVTTRPDPHCPRHPAGTDQPCGACGIARRAHDTWQPPTPTPPTLAERRAELARLTQETA